MWKYFFVFLLVIITNLLPAQVLKNFVFEDSIKTVYVHLKNDVLSLPILRLNTSDVLVLEFDDLDMSRKAGDYQYTFIRCDADWTQSDMFFDEFIEGYEENYVDNYEFSFNTVVNFVHYKIFFPNKNIKFLKSGNYIIKVYKNYDTSQTVLQMRFVVVEPLVEITGNVRMPSIAKFRLSSHEVDFKVLFGDDFGNPLQYSKIFVLRNFDWNTAREVSPRNIRGNELIFSYEEDNIFPAGNEFRFFITKNTAFKDYKTQKISIEGNDYHFYLYKESPATHYFSRQDINGKFFIRNEKGMNDATEADYVYVHFYLKAPLRYKHEIYLYGALTQWRFLPQFRMKYDADKGVYYLTAFLKQGVYNYSYAVKDKFEENPIDGNFYETENQYVVLTYYYDNSFGYYRLIGYAILKSK